MLTLCVLLGAVGGLFALGAALWRAVAFSLPHCAPHLITLPCLRCLAPPTEEDEEPYDAAAWDREITAMLEEWIMHNGEWRMKDSKYTP